MRQSWSMSDAGGMSTVELFDFDNRLERVDWEQAKADLAADHFDNGRSAAALRKSFAQSQHVVSRGSTIEFRHGPAAVDGVSNAYLLDVWTHSRVRGRGIATTLVRRLIAAVPGQHVGLQTEDAEAFYLSLGFAHRPET